MKGSAMANDNTLVRALHDLGLAAWFGGSLMGAVGLNGATGAASDPTERLRLSSLGWAKWTPVQIGAVGVHAIGGIGLIVGNKNRVAVDSETRVNTMTKAVVTLVAAGVTAYSGVLGSKVAKLQHEGAQGATDPAPSNSPELTAALSQLKLTQFAIPVLTGVAVVLGAQQGEQQRDARGLLDR